MSDLEDIDPGAEDLHLEEELSAPAGHPEGRPDEQGEEHFEPPKSGGSAVLKIVIVAVLLAAAGGAYFVMKSSRHPPSLAARIPAQPLPVPPLPAVTNTPDKKGTEVPPDFNNSAPVPAVAANGALPSAASSMPDAIPALPGAAPAAPPAGIPPVVNASAAPASPVAPPAASANTVAAAPAMPAAIPAMPAATPAAPPAGPSSGAPALSATPPIVNDQPPSSALLNSAQGAAPGTPPAAKTNMPSQVSPVPPSPFGAPEQVQTPAEKVVTAMNAGANEPSSPLPSPLSPPSKPQIKNGEAMPSAVVPSVETEADKGEMAKTKTFSPTAGPAGESAAEKTGQEAPQTEESAKVEELQKKIDELEKTISQLQQAPVTKDEAEKSAASAEETAVPKVSHKRIAAHHRRPSAKTHHVAASGWVLKAAKPGVAWIARKGSDDLKMVEAGDSLAGIGRITAIVKSSSGSWVVNGTRGRISQ